MAGIKTLTDEEISQNEEIISVIDGVYYMGFESTDHFRRFIKQSSLKEYGKSKKGAKFYLKEELNEFIEKCSQFHEQYFSYEELIAKGWLHHRIANLNKYEVPYYARIKKFKGKTCGYKKSDAECYLKEKKVIKIKEFKNTDPNLLSIKEVLEYLEISKTLYQKTVSEGYIKPYTKIPPHTFYHIDDLNSLLMLRQEFHDQHYVHKELSQYLTPLGIKKAQRVYIPPYARTDKFFQVMYAFKKEEVQKLSEQYGNKRNDETIKETEALKHYTYKQILELFELEDRNCRKVLTQNEVKKFKIGRSIYYDKSQVDFLKKKQEDLLKEYEHCITYNEALEKGYSRSIIDGVKKNKVVPLLTCKYKSCETIYNELEMIEYVERQSKEDLFHMPEQFNDEYDLFLKKLNIYESMHKDNFNIEGFREKSPVTSTEWFSFVKVEILRRNLSEKRLYSFIKQLIYLTHELIDLLQKGQKDEIYYLGTEKIINFIVDLPIKQRELIISFLSQKQSNFISSLESSNKKIYNIEIIKKYIRGIWNDNNKELLSADIYSVEEFRHCFEYCADLEYHCVRSIEEIKKKHTAKHVSTWLYILIHLNNGWRHYDVATFKDVEVDNLLNEFNIFDIEWFLEKSLTLAQARLILSCVMNRKFIITKTRVEGYFFCSDDLAIPVATAIVILTLFKQKRDCVLGIFGNILMQFDNKFNEPLKSNFKSFFSDMNLEGFVFKSRKMNASLMTYIYSITKDEPSNKAIQSAAMFRGHQDLKSTLHYLKIDKDNIDFISRQLFERGEFGYVYDKLVEKLYCNSNQSLSMEEKTQKIIHIKERLCSAYNIEFVAGFMNRYRNGKEEVDVYLDSLSLDEQQKLLHDIYISSLPSKELNIQCLISGKCNKAGKGITCHQCAYSIPNLYAINQICEKAQEHIMKYHAESIVGEKIKLSVLINHDLEVLSESIQKYGADLVYSFMNISREAYRADVELIPEPIDLFIELN